jgi:nucleotide-binding universal stress UspA family protein
MKVLVGVDGSSNSFAAVKLAGTLLSPDRDELVLLFATPALAVEEELDPEVEQRARSVLSRAVLEAALERLPDGWRQKVAQKEAAGSAGPALLDAIREHGAELVVVGFRGTSSLWERFMLGSVSRAVVHSAPVPVLVVKTKLDEAASAERIVATSSRFRALATYVDSPTADLMANLLWKIAWPANTEGQIIAVVRPMFGFDVPDWVKIERRDPDVEAMASAWQQEHQQNLQAARSRLEEFRSKLPPCFANQSVIVAEGRPAEQIVNQLRAEAIDLAIVGSRGRGRVEQLLVGSTTEQVLASAPCSVLVVR